MGMAADDDAMPAVVEESAQRSVRFQGVAKVVGTERGHVVVAEAMAQEQVAMCRRVLSRRRERGQPSSMFGAKSSYRQSVRKRAQHALATPTVVVSGDGVDIGQELERAVRI